MCCCVTNCIRWAGASEWGQCKDSEVEKIGYASSKSHCSIDGIHLVKCYRQLENFISYQPARYCLIPNTSVKRSEQQTIVVWVHREIAERNKSCTYTVTQWHNIINAKRRKFLENQLTYHLINPYFPNYSSHFALQRVISRSCSYARRGFNRIDSMYVYIRLEDVHPRG